MKIHQWLVGSALVGAMAFDPLFAAETSSAAKNDFPVYAYDVKGNTLLPQNDIERAVYAYLGEHKTGDDIELARASLEKAYHDAGFVTVVVNTPRQRLTEGVAKLDVVESRIGKVAIAGSRYYSLDDIRAAVPSLRAGECLNIHLAREEISALNRLSPHRSITPILKPGKRPGTVDIELRVKDEFPAKTSIEINDRYTENTSKSRLWLNTGFDNLWQAHHSLSLQYQTSPEDTDEVKVLVGTYAMPINDSNDRLAIYAVNSKSDVPATGSLSVLGDGNITGLRYVIPMNGGDNYSHSLTLGADHKNFADAIFFENGEQATQTKISYLQFSLNYRGNLMSEKSNLDFSLTANQGLNGIGNSEREFFDKRVIARADKNFPNVVYVLDQAHPGYFFINGFLNYERKISESGWRAFFGAGGQYTEDLLISNEQYSIGGVESVRGYVESKNAGDRGMFGRAELRTPSFFSNVDQISDSHAYLFGDAGHVSMIKVNAEEKKDFSLSSAGVGYMLSALDGLRIKLDWAYPLKDAGKVERGDSRLHASLSYEF